MRTFESTDVPDHVADDEIVLRLNPKTFNREYYLERTDRNIGWITPDEQELLRESVVGIAGTGGMGGLLGAILVRAGVGEIRIADTEKFDVSNINRQFGAKQNTVNKSKALETARMIREIADDTTIVVYPAGITELSVDDFIKGSDVICDEIEVLAMDARILLHQQARSFGVSLFNCNTTGFSTNLFLYTPQSLTMEEATGFTYGEAREICAAAKAGSTEASTKIAHAMVRAVVPVLPEYRPNELVTDHVSFYQRFLHEQRVPIIATNPPMATGFLANRILLYLLKNSGVKRDITDTPEMPGYLNFDAAHMTSVVASMESNWLKKK